MQLLVKEQENQCMCHAYREEGCNTESVQIEGCKTVSLLSAGKIFLNVADVFVYTAGVTGFGNKC